MTRPSQYHNYTCRFINQQYHILHFSVLISHFLKWKFVITTTIILLVWEAFPNIFLSSGEEFIELQLRRHFLRRQRFGLGDLLLRWIHLLRRRIRDSKLARETHLSPERTQQHNVFFWLIFRMCNNNAHMYDDAYIYIYMSIIDTCMSESYRISFFERKEQ